MRLVWAALGNMSAILRSTASFYNCVKEKNVSNCLRCTEYPCKLRIGISEVYCPIYRRKKTFGVG
ncbi:MAG: DUF3795 domain-containing protein [Methanocellales archaeon]|nr:DUF3795 domain-containing protein [Methanocellales archaeon]